jgi:hypothetical protein
MKATIQDADTLKNISPQQVKAYLKAHGWQQQQKMADKASIWTLGNNQSEA